MATALLLLAVFAVGIGWPSWTIWSGCRQTKTHRAHTSYEPSCAHCVRDRDDAEFWANLHYRQVMAQRQLDAHRERRDKTLAGEGERLRVVAYLALPEGQRYERWLTWQLTNQPFEDPLPYPAPAYPPPA